MADLHLRTPLTDADITDLRAGDVVHVSGIIFAASIAAHERMAQALRKGLPLPFSLAGALLFSVDPSPATMVRPIGSAGPATASRMDHLTPSLHALGLKGTIGKGPRSMAVRQALRHHTAVYFGATGGAGALLSLSIKTSRVAAYEDLGLAALRELTVEDFALLVINDCHGGELHAKPDLAAALG